MSEALRTIPVLGDLIQFQSYAPHIDLTFNQYLLAGASPMLVHAGDERHARQLGEPLAAALKGQALSYIFISHFESDECGGLPFWLDKYPAAIPVCSEVTARQLDGFDICRGPLIEKPGEVLDIDGFTLQFVSYPSEMHLWEGLLAFETRRKVLFSADLFIQFGRGAGEPRALEWEKEIELISPRQLPSPDARSTLQAALRKLPVDLVAPGHGPFLARG
jgi:flavorubredoxin